MTQTEIERLVGSLARDLRLSSLQKHELANAARRLAALPDDEVRREAHAYGSRSVDRLVGGAVGALAAGITAGRFAATLSEAERTSYEDGLHGIGRNGGEDSGAMTDPDVVDAMAKAAALDQAGHTAEAARIRRAVEAHECAKGEG